MEEDIKIIRLNKYLAHCGEWTRKQAVDIIKQGEVLVNGVQEVNPFYEVHDQDIVTLRGKVLAPVTRPEYLLTNKAKNNHILSNKEAENPAVEDLIKKTTQIQLSPMLQCPDMMSGLMLWSNDQALGEKLSYQHKLKAVFTMNFDLVVDQKMITKLLNKAKKLAINITGLSYVDGDNMQELGVEMIGGHPVALYQFFQSNHLHPIKMDCTFIGGLTKKDLKRGWSRLLTDKEIIFLKHFS